MDCIRIIPINDVIHPRSPRETMCGWSHLPRYIDKIRLHLAGKLHPDYQANFGKGYDGMWLKAAGLTHEEFVEVVKQSLTDGEVADWVLRHVKRSEVEKEAHRQDMMNRPQVGDSSAQERLQMRKREAGIVHRDDIKTFVDCIDADEKRL